MKNWDVIILGSGPAGCAAAMRLSSLNCRVVMLDKLNGQRNDKLGESLPPKSIGLVQELIETLPDAHKTTGNVSCWESDEPQSNDFFFTPPGYGLRLNRSEFDRALRDKAVHSGVKLETPAPVKKLSFENKQWLIPISNEGRLTHHCAPYLIDCTGRNSLVTRQLGIDKFPLDKLFSFALRLESPKHDSDFRTHIEASREGWWYSVLLPQTKLSTHSERLVVFHTDKDLPSAKLASHVNGFQLLIKNTRHIKHILSPYDFHPRLKIQGAPANSERSAQFSGANWLAAGDASQAFDPLSSQGIYKALRSGYCAANTVANCLNGNTSSFSEYDQFELNTWHEYQKQRQYYYQCQPRWPNEIFWKRRNAPAIKKEKEAL